MIDPEQTNRQGARGAPPFGRDAIARAGVSAVVSGCVIALMAYGLAPAAPDAPPPLRVAVCVPPQADFVERIGGPHVVVSVLVAPGREPHTFEPSPRQVIELGTADLYVRGGMPFEDRVLEKVRGSGRALRIVDPAADLPRRAAPEDHHEDAGSHQGPQQQVDPHVWLAPPLIKIQARAIARALAEADPARAADYQQNLLQFLDEIEATDARIRALLAPFRGESFYVFHPAFGYFGDAYGLRQVAVEVDGKAPSPRQLARLIERARGEGVRVVFVQPGFSPQSARAIAEAIGGAVVPLDPQARDVLPSLLEMATQLQRALAADEGRTSP